MDSILGLLRHLLTFGGGIAVAKGYTDEATATSLIGAVVTLIGGAWSIWEKISRTPSA